MIETRQEADTLRAAAIAELRTHLEDFYYTQLTGSGRLSVMFDHINGPRRLYVGTRAWKTGTVRFRVVHNLRRRGNVYDTQNVAENFTGDPAELADIIDAYMENDDNWS